MSATQSQLREAAKLLLESENVLIFTHQRPDGDALGSSFGLKYFLESSGKKAEVFIPGTIPHRHTKLFSGYLSDLPEDKFNAFDTFVSVDCANPARLGAPEFLTIEELRTKRFINIDHHGGNSMGSAFFNLVSGNTASCSELLVKIMCASEITIPEKCASPLLTGMMTDTGCFRFSNTSADTMRNAAILLERGAELEKIVNAVFFSKPLNQMRFENELMREHLKFALDNRIAYACIPPELAKKYDFNIKEDEGLIDLLREIDGVIIAMLLYEGPGGIKISMRSKESRYPVGPVARAFNGGGHELAAGATYEGSIGDAEKALVEKLTQLFA
ncbi:MAG: bifunctional oligoribonuclease/PAP phosphatase NrnA [Lentisphaeria bacterium]|nr:bifunctional oligoribonuclease/PAP phosphatase NrnA [Lentisphaeria bacterium]